MRRGCCTAVCGAACTSADTDGGAAAGRAQPIPGRSIEVDQRSSLSPASPQFHPMGACRLDLTQVAGNRWGLERGEGVIVE